MDFGLSDEQAMIVATVRSFVAAQDVADMALFLASNAARMVSGQALAVDAFTINPDPQV